MKSKNILTNVSLTKFACICEIGERAASAEFGLDCDAVLFQNVSYRGPKSSIRNFIATENIFSI